MARFRIFHAVSRPLVRGVVRLLAPALVALAVAPAHPGALAAQSAGGQAAVVAVLHGRVTSPDGPVAAARVVVREDGPEAGASGRGDALAVAGSDGSWRIGGLRPGRYRVEVRALGHVHEVRTVALEEGESLRLDVLLENSALPVDPVVVTGTLRETRVGDSPVKVDVVSARLLQRNASSNLMESIGHINGLYQQVDCGVCYTNNIRINGMEGPYTAVLIDGMPIMGALASVYGLNGIDPALIERLEILKGPQSTLYGAEAMGGVVNVITKDARFAPRFSLDGSRTSLGESSLSFGAARDGERMGALVGGNAFHSDRFVDDNGDGFSDVTLDTRISLFGKVDLRHDGWTVAQLTSKLYREDRFGGVEAWTEADRGSGEVYGESIETRRFELMGETVRPWNGVRAALSYALHRQDSWYGDQPFQADQHIGFGQLLWTPPDLGYHDVLVGAALRIQAYDDDTPATVTSERRVIPGLFVQDEWRPTETWTFLGGVRADRHAEHGVILSPRASVKWSPLENTTFRVNGGTGFRVVNLFTEDHAALTGAREVVIRDDLRPERSRSVAFNANQILEFGANPMMIDLDLFHTRFSNKIQPDYDVHPDRIVYGNLEGHAVSRGVSLSLNQNFDHVPLLYTLGMTFQDVSLHRGERADGSAGDAGSGAGAGAGEPEFFSPEYKGVWTVSYTFEGRLTLDWTGTVVGPMRLPEYPAPFERPTRSRAYDVHNLQATLRTGAGSEVYLSVKNVADFTQGSPLVDPGRPFGEAFDTNYVWGPIVGRKLMLGLRLARGR